MSMLLELGCEIVRKNTGKSPQESNPYSAEPPRANEPRLHDIFVDGGIERLRLVLDAVQAQGGIQAVSELQIARRTVKGTWVVEGKEEPVEGWEMWQVLPFQYRNELTIGGFPTVSFILNLSDPSGANGWRRVGDGEYELLSPDEVKEATKQLEVEGVDLLLPLLYGTGHIPPLVEATAVNAGPFRSVEFQSHLHVPITLFFEVHSNLMSQRESDSPSGRQKVSYEEFEDQKGLKIPMHIKGFCNDKLFASLDVIKFERFPSLDNEKFLPESS